MALIATSVQPAGVVRMFFDLRLAPSDPKDEERIAEAIESAAARAMPDGEIIPLSQAA